MKATLDLELLGRLTSDFPGGGWETIRVQKFVKDRGGRLLSDWNVIPELGDKGGVYAILLPAELFPKPCTIHLHAPHRHKGDKIPFEFSVQPLSGDTSAVVYIGRTSRFIQRWQGHLTSGPRKNGGQVKYGLVDCGLFSEPDALRYLRSNALIVYHILDGPENCANRDILEMSLCVRFAPPFNIKSER